MMDAGNSARELSGDNSILALGVAAAISSKRPKSGDRHPERQPRTAHIINSLKHPEEVAKLRLIYPQGFYLIGVSADDARRQKFLTEVKQINDEQAQELMLRDEDEHIPHGQRVRDTFHMSDFFVNLSGDGDELRSTVVRTLDILFGHPYRTPTFDEYAMFSAFVASLRSADLSRQVGAVVAKQNEVLSTGANDCPSFGGGQYWPAFNTKSHEIEEKEDGRDYMRGEDANEIEQQRIVEDILKEARENGISAEKLREVLESSRIQDLTEFGRAVHAEMEAILACARKGVSTVDATLYSTTFPCHNCAKHIVGAGIKRVVFIEPYTKSKALDLHSDAISLGKLNANDSMVNFEPFVGIGPRRFFDLFSMKLGSGHTTYRKDSKGYALKFDPAACRLRIQMLPCSYMDLELLASNLYKEFEEKRDGRNGN